jgi:hypothetical protein
MSVVHMESCADIRIGTVTADGFDVAVSAINTRRLSVDKIVTRNVRIPLSLKNCRDVGVSEISAAIPEELALSLAADIHNGSSYEDIKEKYGDRLIGYGVNLDKFLERAGNGSSVLSLILQALGF